jgi:hypothetical protein
VGAAAPPGVGPLVVAARCGHRSTTPGPGPSPCGRARPRVPPYRVLLHLFSWLCHHTTCLRRLWLRPCSYLWGPLPRHPGPQWLEGRTRPLVAAFSTIAMTPPPFDWVVDSAASYHTTSTAGTLSHSLSPHPSHPSSIIVGNSSTLPVTSVRASVLSGPFNLNDVLIAPHIIHILFSVLRFTTANSCSIELRRPRQRRHARGTRRTTPRTRTWIA